MKKQIKPMILGVQKINAYPNHSILCQGIVVSTTAQAATRGLPIVILNAKDEGALSGPKKKAIKKSGKLIRRMKKVIRRGELLP